MIKVSVFCILRDSEKTLSKLFSQLEELESLKDYEFSYFFYENDSLDNTRELIKNWMKLRKGNFLFENLGAKKFGSVADPERMRFLCDCRNKNKNLAGENKSEYSLLIDSDIEFNSKNFLLHIEAINNLPEAIMITPNVRQPIKDLMFGETQDSYYDVYAFRDNFGNKGVYFTDCPSFLINDQKAWKKNKPIKVLSAFGGFALIKSSVFNKVEWSADINCDHCNMCFLISRMGQIYILPNSIVKVNLDLKTINLEGCQNIAQQQKNYYDYIWNNSI